MQNHISDSEKKQFNISWRSILIGLLLIPFNNYWILHQEALWYARMTYGVPYGNVIIILTFCTFLNGIIKRTAIGKHALDTSELMVIYILLCIASSFACHHALGGLITLISYPFWFATPENEFQQLIQPNLPGWLTVSDKSALAPYYQGGSSFFIKQHIMAWLSPLLWWALFAVVLFLSMVCLGGILRRQWTNHERFTYPLTEIPLQIAKPEYRLFRNRLFWIGFGIAGSLTMLSALNFLFPSVPHIELRRHNLVRFTNQPFSYMGNFRVTYNPFLIGTCYFMPLDLSFSLWFFFLLSKVQLLVSGAMGQSKSGFPYIPEQSAGAFITIFLGTIWVARKHLKEVFLSAIGKGKLSSSEEPMRYSLASFGFLACVIFLIIFSVRAGASPFYAMGFFFVYYAITIAITRVRAQLGFPLHGLESFTPYTVLANILGTRRISHGTMGVSTLYIWFSWETFSTHPMPHQMEGYHIAQRLNKGKQRLTFATILAVTVTTFATFVILLDFYYKEGGDTGKFNWTTRMYGIYGYDLMKNWITFPSTSDVGRTGGILSGSLFGAFLMAMRRRFVFWPFHILGYSMAGTWAMYHFWSIGYISFILKFSILRFGGLKGYRKAVPFFMGLILGEITVGGLWLFFGLLLDRQVYEFFPG